MTLPNGVLRRADVGRIGAELGHGSMVRVFDLPELRLDDVGEALAFREHRSAPDGAGELVARRAALPAALRVQLDEITAWPVRLVIDDDPAARVVGVVVRRIPEHFMTYTGLPGVRRTVVRTAEFLSGDTSDVPGAEQPPVEEVRWAVCRDVAGALDLLHGPELDVTVGPLDARDVAVRPAPAPTAVLIGCEGFRPGGDTRPEDLRQLGIFVRRCLVPVGSGATGFLDPAGVRLLERAVDAPPLQRPTAAEWLDHLGARYRRVAAAPRLDAVELDRSLVGIGQPVTVSWRAVGATTIEVSGINCQPHTVDVLGRTGSISVRPTGSGPLDVIACNHRGEHRLTTAPVFVQDIPPLGDLPVPMPRMDLPAVTELPDLASVLPPLPVSAMNQPPGTADLAALWAAPVPALWAQPAVRPWVRPVEIEPPPGFGCGPNAFPIDLTSILSGAPTTLPVELTEENP